MIDGEENTEGKSRAGSGPKYISEDEIRARERERELSGANYIRERMYD